MKKINTYTKSGNKKTPTTYPKSMEKPTNINLMAQVIRVYEGRKHQGLSKVKTRSEVKISTKKIYRQKGTGLARHGAKSAPIFVGGGIAHGPKGIKRQLSLPKKMRKGALKIALSMKAENGKISVVEGLASLKKTKEAVALLSKVLKDDKGKKTLAVLAGSEKSDGLSLRNLKNVEVAMLNDLNAYDVFYADNIIFEKQAFELLGKARKEKKGKAEDEMKSEKTTPKTVKSRREKSKDKSKDNKKKVNKK